MHATPNLTTALGFTNCSNDGVVVAFPTRLAHELQKRKSRSNEPLPKSEHACQ